MQDGAKFWLWTALLATAGVGSSFALACAVPLAAFATLAALDMSKAEAIALLTIVWLANQLVGYAFHDYPRDAMTFAWGAALWISAIVAFAAARATMSRVSDAVKMGVGFVAAFVGYEGSLYVAQFAFGWDSAAYAPAVVAGIAGVNALAFVVLLALHRGAIWLGVAPRPDLAARTV